MKERKVTGKLLVYYLNLAELGDKNAEEKAKKIGAKLFFEEEPLIKISSRIKVIFPTGRIKEYNSAKEVMLRFQIDLDTLRKCIEFGYTDDKGRLYERIENK